MFELIAVLVGAWLFWNVIMVAWLNNDPRQHKLAQILIDMSLEPGHVSHFMMYMAINRWNGINARRRIAHACSLVKLKVPDEIYKMVIANSRMLVCNY